jgi:hypothetical protein
MGRSPRACHRMLPKHPLLQKCLKALEAIPTFQTKVGAMPYVTADFLADGQLFIENAQGQAEYIYEIKSDVTRDTIDAVIQYFGSLQQRLPGKTRALLITHQLSDQTVDRLVEKEIEFVDATGNIYLNSPRNYVFVRRPHHRETRNPATEITSITIQLMYLLLRNPGGLRGDQVEYQLAELAGITVPTIQKHLTRLVDLGYVQRKRKGYKIVDYLQLFERWELGYAEVLRSELLIGTFSRVKISTHDLDATIQMLKLENNLKLLFGGENAARILINDFGSPHVTLHLAMFKPSFLVNLGLKPDTQGDVVLLKTFGLANDCWCDPWMEGDFHLYVDPLLTHAELNLSHDDRVKTVAQRLFEQYIAPRADV